LKGAAPLYALNKLQDYLPSAYVELVRRYKRSRKKARKKKQEETMNNNNNSNGALILPESEMRERLHEVSCYDPSEFDKLLKDYFANVEKYEGSNNVLITSRIRTFLFCELEKILDSVWQGEVKAWLKAMSPTRAGWGPVAVTDGTGANGDGNGD